jgi:hypothetical protein
MLLVKIKSRLKMNSLLLQLTLIPSAWDRPSLRAEREKRVSQITILQTQIYNQLKIYNTTISGISDGRLTEERRIEIYGDWLRLIVMERKGDLL